AAIEVGEWTARRRDVSGPRSLILHSDSAIQNPNLKSLYLHLAPENGFLQVQKVEMFPDYKYWKNRAPLCGERPSLHARNVRFRQKFRAADPDFLPDTPRYGTRNHERGSYHLKPHEAIVLS